ncbi:MAG: hypothetical protein JXA42_16760 [Anaerolineales bacterium]|nr:hypothetical protein [Anaerolineales bacterium]
MYFIKRFKILTIVFITFLLPVLGACGPAATPEVIKETVEITKEVEKIVKETVIVESEPQVVEKEVTKVVEVEVEKMVTPTPLPSSIKRGGVLKIAYQDNFMDLDPMMLLHAIDTGAYDIVYESLVKWDVETLEPLPSLAKRWEISDDGLTYTFYLQEGIKWQNGDDFTADDVKFSMDRILDPESGAIVATMLSSVDSTEVIDEYTVSFYLKEPFSPFLAKLPGSFKVVNQDFVEDAGGMTNRTMMGTGPFMLEEWTPDEVTRFIRNPNYWRAGEDGQQLPYLDAIEFYPMPDDTARVDAFLSGVVDFLHFVPDKDVERIMANSDIILSEPWSTYYSYVGFNLGHPPFDDPLVRQAISWSLDREEISHALFDQVFPLYDAALPPWHWAYTEHRAYNHQDIEKAKELLAEAGYPDGFDVTVHACYDFQNELKVCEMAITYLQEIGIDATIETSEWGIHVDNFTSGNFPIWCDGNMHDGDPDDAYYNTFHSNGEWNFWDYSNPEVDRLLEEGRRVSDLAERKEIYRQVEEILLEEVPAAFAILNQFKEAYYPYVMNYQHMGNGRWEGLIDVWLDK